MNRLKRPWIQTQGLVVVAINMTALAGTTVPGWAATSIASCPSVITTPGNYVVTADLSCAGIAIDINASNVSLNLNGHIITGSNVTGGIRIFGTSSNRLNHVAVEGPGLIQKFDIGVSIGYADYCQLKLVTIAHNQIGLLASGDVSYLTVASNVVVANHSGMVLMTPSITGGVIAYNDVSGNGSGMFVAGGMTVNNNVVNGNAGDGIDIEGSFTRVYANTTNGNAGGGIRVNNPPQTGNQIFNNTSSKANGTFDLEDVNSACGTDVWADNVFFTRNRSCIH